jgi:PAS domain S-box-containing protein
MSTIGNADIEVQRLRTLHECQALDTEPERVYDDITRLLAMTCDMPMAVVSLVDGDRVWFKSKVGLTLEEMPRENSLCEYAIREDDIFEVPDMLEHEVLRDNPMVIGGPEIRSYASTRIVMPNGHSIGLVAIMDVRPRELTRDQRETLFAMGRQVASHLELRRRMLEQERDKENLERVRERLDLVVEAACDGIWDLDLNLRCVYLSPRVFSMLGLSNTTGEVPLVGIWPMVHPEDRRQAVRKVVRQLRRGRNVDCEFRCRHIDSGWRWFRVRGVAVPSSDGESRRLVGSLSDIHDHRLSQQHLQRVSRLLEESQTLGKIGGWELDLATQQLFWTAETYRIYEVDPELYEPSIVSALAFCLPDGRRRMHAAIADAVSHGKAFSLDIELLTARKRHRWVRVTGGAAFDEGNAVRILGAIQDITLQRRFDEELLKAKDAAEAASVAKSAFLAAMSHEIRTPMHTVLGYADLLRCTGLQNEQREFLSAIASAGSSLLRLIDDILDFSKAEAGKVVLECAAFDLQLVVNDVARMMRPQANHKGIDLRVVIDESESLRVLADPQRVHQVLVNLAGNAVKFTSRGSVVISVRMHEGRVRVTVKDTGIGISEAGLDKLFGDFVQVDSTSKRRYGGTGLGLAISKQLVEAMGGEIGVVSEEGVGSNFWIDLSVPDGSGREAHSESVDPVGVASVDADTLDGRTVLVAEDNRMNLRLVVRVLESFGLEVETAVDGAQAATMACQKSYDLVLMDCLMPGVDGFEATRRIRTHEAAADKRTPVIALTANALPEDRDMCISAGMDGFVSKPFTKNALRQAVMHWMVKSASETAS